MPSSAHTEHITEVAIGSHQLNSSSLWNWRYNHNPSPRVRRSDPGPSSGLSQMPSQDPSSYGSEEEDSLQAGGVTLAVFPSAAARLDGGSRIATPRMPVRTTGGLRGYCAPGVPA